MKFSAAKASDKSLHSFCLFEKTDQLSSLGLNGEEMAYIQKRSESKGLKIIKINRYSHFIYLIKLKKEKKAAHTILEECRIAGYKALRMIGDSKPDSITVQSFSKALNAVAFAEGLGLGAYRFLKYFSNKKERQLNLKKIAVVGASQVELNELNAVVSGTYKARDLVNEPVNFLTAVQLSREAKKAGEKFGFKVEILNKKRIETLKMGGLLAVNKGSQDPPTFTIMEHHPSDAKNAKPVILVGKGVVYDTGGLSLKPTAGSMDSMKSDMGGAAAVLGTMIALAKAKVPLHVIGLIPATDNRPGEKAYVPGDVITMYDGTTVEVLNTDAEGRMILADALTYAKKYKPEVVIDLATLTGSAAMAIGKFGIVAMGNARDEEFEKLEKSGENVYERIVRFPFWDEYNDLLKSSIADVKNIGGREGGAITAGKFLERFTDYPYIHLDIAGPAFLNADDKYRLKGGTGTGVRLMFDYLKNKV